jgi:hypothetical protein
LRAEPFNLNWGDSVYAKLKATNVKGTSSFTSSGNGAILITNPDVPVSLTEVYAQRSESTLGLSWSEGLYDGESPLIDYRINMAELGGTFSVIATGITVTSYTATGLNAGTTYEFKVEARNSFDFSSPSEVLSLKASWFPEPPTTVTTNNVDANVEISWSDPVSNGEPITAYRIYIQESGSATYIEETVDCIGNDVTLVSSRACSIAIATLKAAPYSLAQGESISAKVISINVYGESALSDAGSGAVI